MIQFIYRILCISFFLFGIISCVTVIEREGPDIQGYYWQKDGQTGIPVIHRGFDVYLYCGLEEKAESCSIIREDGICHIYLPEDPESWMEPHERKHCGGWTHPDSNWLKG